MKSFREVGLKWCLGQILVLNYIIQDKKESQVYSLGTQLAGGDGLTNRIGSTAGIYIPYASRTVGSIHAPSALIAWHLVPLVAT